MSQSAKGGLMPKLFETAGRETLSRQVLDGLNLLCVQ
jgi:hypothetical protein